MGPKTMEFERRFADYIGAAYSVSMNSCTAGLHLALKAIDLQEGDEVIIPTITFTATAEVITYFKAKPVFVDVEVGTCNIDPLRIEEKITRKTRAIIPVHYAGQPCDMDEIISMARRYGLYVIEDAAHAIPAWYRNRKVGTIGDMTCFSFYATKSLTTGEGGMVTTGNEEWADRLRTLRLHGISRDAWKRYTKEGSWFYEVMEAGFKYNMTDLQAALGLAQLRKVEWMWQRRKEIAKSYGEALGSLTGVEVPVVKDDRESSWHLYVIKFDVDALKIERNQLIEELKDRGIMTSVHFIPLYRHPYYKQLCNCDAGEFPVSEYLYERFLSLPIYPGMTDRDVERVAESVIDVLAAGVR